MTRYSRFSALLLYYQLLLTLIAARKFQYHDDEWGGTCGIGQKQSPIDIHTADVHVRKMPHLIYEHYAGTQHINVSNNGHSLVVSGFTDWEKRPQLLGGGLEGRYLLDQFHLHWGSKDHQGSEHQIGFLSYPGELHLVHVRDGLTLSDALKTPGGIAVVAIFLRIGTSGNALSALDTVISEIQSPGVVRPSTVDVRSLLPENSQSFYRYEGSLTTPGCEEAVVWTILTESVSVTVSQINKLRLVKLDHDDDHNFRAPQPLNGRVVYYRPSHDSYIDTPADTATTVSTLLAIAIALLFY